MSADKLRNITFYLLSYFILLFWFILGCFVVLSDDIIELN